MKMSETRKACLCLLSQVCYLAIVVLLLVLRLYVKIPVFTQIVAFVGLMSVDFCPVISLITGGVAMVYFIRAMFYEKPKLFIGLMLVLTITITLVVVFWIEKLQPILFYG